METSGNNSGLCVPVTDDGRINRQYLPSILKGLDLVP